MLTSATTQLRMDVSPTLYAEVAEPGTCEHEEILRFQQERFALVSDPGARRDVTFVETTDYAPDRTIPMGVYQRVSGGGSGTLIGAARLELPGATVIETMIRLAPGTPAAEALARHQVAELGGFATPVDLDKATLTDVVDALVALIVRIAPRYGIEWLWIFPRKGMISVLRASIPGLLPPYRFTYCPDWQGWQEESPQYQQFRALGLRGIPDQPQLFQIRRVDFAADLAQRLALRATRVARATELEDRFRGAMWQAERDINDEIVRRHNETHDFSVTVRENLNLNSRAGLRILNPDCGTGQSLTWLHEHTGADSVVVGVEENVALVQQARQTTGGPHRADLLVFQGTSRRLTFPNGLFDRIYADQTPERPEGIGVVLAELERVLAPGGILSLVLADREIVEVDAGRYASRDDTAVLERLRAWYRRTFPRQLSTESLRAKMSRGAWENMRVSELTATFTDFARVKAFLLLPEAYLSLLGHDDAFAQELAAFERRLERAARAVSLAARVRVNYVWARKALSCQPAPVSV